MTFLGIIRVATVLQIGLLSLFLLFHKGVNNKQNALLALFIISKACFLIDALLIAYYSVVMQYSSNLIMIGTSFQLIIGPALFYTIVVTTDREFHFKIIHLLHFVPFLLLAGFIFFNYHIYPWHYKLSLFQHGFPYSTSWFRPITTFIYTQFTIYGLSALIILSRRKEEIYKFSSLSIEKNIAYLKFIVVDFIVVWGINIVSMYVQFGHAGWMVLQTATVFNIFFIANLIVYQGLKFPQIFHGDGSERQKYARNVLSDGEKNGYVNKILACMAADKPYLNPELSLSDFAARLALPSHVVSQILNSEFKKNFYDFVNSYRIEESKNLLIDPSDGKNSILSVLYGSGFNSKSVFNAAFKKHTGMTPREFKKTSKVLTY
jgi:AraC-like DNA-binding protein